MADQTPIEWTDATWNIITGCSVVSPGCTNCYAMKLAGTRLQHHPSRAGLTTASKAGPVWNGQVRFNAEWLTQPLRWSRCRMIFVCAHGDLFHEGVPDEWLDQIFAVMALCPQHTFQVLTKRPERMRAYLSEACGRIADTIMRMRRERGDKDMIVGPLPHIDPGAAWWPLPNVWLGVSVEDQARADERIPVLLDTPAAVRWISAEPLLGPIDLEEVPSAPGASTRNLFGPLSGYCQRHWPRTDCGCPRQQPRIDWVVAGGESGPGARPMHPDWARQLRDQCAEAGVPFLFKQWGAWAPIDAWAPADRRPQRAIAQAGWEVDDFVAPEEVPGGQRLMNVGKKAAGRHLDGQLHDGFPTTAEARG